MRQAYILILVFVVVAVASCELARAEHVVPSPRQDGPSSIDLTTNDCQSLYAFLAAVSRQRKVTILVEGSALSAGEILAASSLTPLQKDSLELSLLVGNFQQAIQSILLTAVDFKVIRQKDTFFSYHYYNQSNVEMFGYEATYPGHKKSQHVG